MTSTGTSRKRIDERGSAMAVRKWEEVKEELFSGREEELRATQEQLHGETAPTGSQTYGAPGTSPSSRSH
jgi:hypothetical protein